MKICPACAGEFEDSEVSCPKDGAALVKLDTGAGERAEELVGQVVDGRYRVERIIGKGGMGTVYACRHIVVGKQFAMKVLRPGIERSEEVLQRFIREAQAANAVKSRHICEMSDFGQLAAGGGAFYVIMELLEGISLTRALREKRLDTDALCQVFAQCCVALDKAHARGIIHRDLKPDNVMLVHEDDDPYFVKLVDFGIAKMMRSKAGDLTETGVILGTPYYMSPEQARGDQLDQRSDIYALGVMMYRAFTGKLPFVADTAMGVLTRHLTETPELPSRIADMEPALERLILRCMEKKAIDRFQTMQDVSEAIVQVRRRIALANRSEEIRATHDERSVGARPRGPLRASPTRADTPGARISEVPPPADSVTNVRDLGSMPPPPTVPEGAPTWGMPPEGERHDTSHPHAESDRFASTPEHMPVATGPHAPPTPVPPPPGVAATTVVSSSHDVAITGPQPADNAAPPPPAAPPHQPTTPSWAPGPMAPQGGGVGDAYPGEAATDRGLVAPRGASLAPGRPGRRTAWIGALAAVLVLGLGLGAIAVVSPGDETTPRRPGASDQPAEPPNTGDPPPPGDDADRDAAPADEANGPAEERDEQTETEDPPDDEDTAADTDAPEPGSSASAAKEVRPERGSEREPNEPTAQPKGSPEAEPTTKPEPASEGKVPKHDDGVRSPFD